MSGDNDDEVICSTVQTITLIVEPVTTILEIVEQATIMEIVQASIEIVTVAQQGIPGAPGGTITYTYSFQAPALTWNIPHFLNRYPAVTIIDTTGEILLASFVYTDSNVITVSFSAPTAGAAYLN